MSTASWPTEIWTHQGVKPFKDPNPTSNLIKRLGFTEADAFTQHTGVRIKEGVDVAQVVDSNLFKVAAGAVGVDWASFRAKLVAKEGMDKALRPRVYVQDSQGGELKWIDRSAWEADQGTGRYTARFSKTDEAGNEIDYEKGQSHVSVEDGDDYQDWGKTDAGVEVKISDKEKEDLDKMQDWLKSNESDVSRSTSSVWDNPPSGHDYGFDNDNLWEALGIDPSKPPPTAAYLTDPSTGKTLDYEFNLLAPRTSHFKIPVPDGYGFGDHPGTRSGSFVNTYMASEMNERTDMTGVPVAGHTYPGGAHPGPTDSSWHYSSHNEGFKSTQPRAGQTSAMDESKYRE
tara:strand:- start:171 stop:1199 length:1029 start_codon:yes stop_codon:yes gene_type:complete